ncbi:MAG: class I SAM-dependent methyltransferase [Candidatus Altiarchaeota archaeon]
MPKSMQWGSFEIRGPRHELREEVMLRTLLAHCHPERLNLFLEAGCGSASFSIKLLERFPNLKGVGFDRGAGFGRIVDGKTRGKAYGFSVHEGGFDDIPSEVSDKKYDLIICGEVLEHLEDDRSAVKKMHDLLNRGGYLLASVPHRRDYWTVEDELSSHFRRYEVDDAKGLMTAAGFRTVSSIVWGFPATKLYAKQVYGRMISSGHEAQYRDGLPQRLVSRAIFSLLRLDLLFLGDMRGIGLVLLCQKKSEGEAAP